ncbi:hypothetical protein TNCV_4802721 [Trichonephila clavipes]|nr:hypothetical protein TNCV_4802721 [Trichonephila clavipes]
MDTTFTFAQKGTKGEQSHLNFRSEVTLTMLHMKLKVHSVPGPRAHSYKSLRQSDAHYLVPLIEGRCAVGQKNTTRKNASNAKKVFLTTMFSKNSLGHKRTHI